MVATDFGEKNHEFSFKMPVRWPSGQWVCEF